jgi:gliding motility-associatede transport system auxiliary component
MQIAVFAIMGLVAMLVGLILLLTLPGLGLVALGVIALGIIFVVSAGVIEFRRVRSALISKRGKFSTSAVILISIFTSIVLLLNAISVAKYYRFDFTGLSKFTLTSQTKDVLTELNEPVEVLCFFVPEVKNIAEEYQEIYQLAGPYALALLQEYRNYTEKLIIKIIDPEAHPEQAAKYGITDTYLYQSVVFETGQGTRLITAGSIYYQAEHAFTSAILEVTGIKQKKIYFLTGHGEASPADESGIGYSYAREGLLDNLFQVGMLDLISTPQIPDDCAVLVVAGPKKEMNESERQIIADYLNANGTVFFLTNPGSPDDIAKLCAPWGIDVKNGTIIDPASYSTPNKDTPIITRDRNYWGMTTLYFPGVTAIVQTENVPASSELIPMLMTTKDSWMTDEYSPSTNPVYDPEKDLKGPLYIGYILTAAESTDTTDVENQSPNIGVIGDSDFASNTNFINGNNGDAFVSIVNILSAGKELISIGQKPLQTRRLVLTPEKANFLRISSIAILPAVILLIGIVFWWRRR